MAGARAKWKTEDWLEEVFSVCRLGGDMFWGSLEEVPNPKALARFLRRAQPVRVRDLPETERRTAVVPFLLSGHQDFPDEDEDDREVTRFACRTGVVKPVRRVDEDYQEYGDPVGAEIVILCFKAHWEETAYCEARYAEPGSLEASLVRHCRYFGAHRPRTVADAGDEFLVDV